MKYSAPIVEIEVLKADDIVLLSNVEVEAEGTLTEVSWGTFA